MPATLPCATLMLQATASDAGKSVITAALIRAFRAQGIRALPFKPQNMSNNAAVTEDGGEIGRAQALQALAAGVAPTVHMNPVLLKPQAEARSQIIVQGQYWGQASAAEYYALKTELWPYVQQSAYRLAEQADLLIVEGAGSASEVNLQEGDIANMGFAERFALPVILIGDIERGGVLASLVGTYQLLPPAHRALIKGYVINKFRGDKSLFQPALDVIKNATGWECFGIVPHFEAAHLLPQEDGLGVEVVKAKQKNKVFNYRGKESDIIDIAVLRFKHLANFDDLDALRAEAKVRLHIIEAGMPIPEGMHLVLLLGSKSTIADYTYLCANGWDIDIKAHVRQGRWVVGLCGGYQMLGRRISDSEGLEGPPQTIEALGLLDFETRIMPQKSLRLLNVKENLWGNELQGYEIHMGQSCGHAPSGRRFLQNHNGDEGLISADGKVIGCYLHGLFNNDSFRVQFLQQLAKNHSASPTLHAHRTEKILDDLAEHLSQNCDLMRVAEIVGLS